MRSRVTFILLFITRLLYAQTYNKLLDNSTWYENINYGWGGAVTFEYRQADDTVINSILYSKINNSSYVCALREDSINKIVYKIDAGDSIEYKLYDFNLIPGDTFSARINGITYPAIIQQKDTVATLQGPRSRWLWKIDTGLDRYIYVIEGVGSTDDPIRLMNVILDPVYSLVCNYQANLQIYQNSSGLICPSLVTATVSEKNDQLITVYPNPSDGIFNVVFNDESAREIQLIDPLGNCVYRLKTTLKKNRLSIDLPQQVYILSVTDQDKNVKLFKRLIITR